MLQLFLTRAGNFWIVDLGINALSILSLNLQINYAVGIKYISF